MVVNYCYKNRQDYRFHNKKSTKHKKCLSADWHRKELRIKWQVLGSWVQKETIIDRPWTLSLAGLLVSSIKVLQRPIHDILRQDRALGHKAGQTWKLLPIISNLINQLIPLHCETYFLGNRSLFLRVLWSLAVHWRHMAVCCAGLVLPSVWWEAVLFQK